jgi:hypothetical protein
MNNHCVVYPAAGNNLTQERYESICQTKLQELESKSLELQQTWDTFVVKLRIANDNDGPVPVKPDMNVLRRAIEKAQAQIHKNQESKLSKVVTFFSKSAQSVDNHNYLFDLLPRWDKYTSLGTLRKERHNLAQL